MSAQQKNSIKYKRLSPKGTNHFIAASIKYSFLKLGVKRYLKRLSSVYTLNTSLGFTFSERNRQTGFTLIELLVAATILVTLAGGVFLSLNPIAQISKSQDAQRQQDLQAVKTALDLYYSDNKCYPATDKVPFGQEWSVGNTVYMNKVPQDPKCNNGQGSCYKYRTDTTSSCPQWNVLFAQLSKSSSLANTCPLSSLSSCTPAGYSSANWACTLSGAVNCSNLASSASIIGGVQTVSPTSTPTPLPSSTPTPTPTPPAGSYTYNIGSNPNNNPYIYQATIMPLYQTIGNPQSPNLQSMNINITDNAGNVNSVKVVLTSDNGQRLFTFSLVGGTVTNGTWGGTWSVNDTYNKQYGYDITATDDKGNTQSTRITVKN